MFESISKFLNNFLNVEAGKSILVILLIMISLFFIITLILFFITIYLRIKNSYRDSRKKRHSQQWDPIILAVMDGSLPPHQAYDQLKWKKSNEYLLHLELYVDMVKGEEKQRLLKLGRLSSEKLHHLLIAKNRRKRLYGVHLLGLFQPVDQYKYLRFDGNDFELTLTTIRELRTVNDFLLKEKLINMLFVFKYISPIYISNILVDMGEEIIPILRIIILDRKDHPYEQIIAIETLRRMHYSGCLDMAEKILEHIDHPVVLTSYLKYMEEMGDERQVNLIIPFLDHSSPQVRKAAVKAYLALNEDLTAKDIYRFFNDPVVQIAVSAANKLKLMNTVPYIGIEEINQLKWADIYKRMVY